MVGNVRVTAVAEVNDSRTFICTSELDVGVADFFKATLRTTLADSHVCVESVTLDGLDVGLQLLSQG